MKIWHLSCFTRQRAFFNYAILVPVALFFSFFFQSSSHFLSSRIEIFFTTFHLSVFKVLFSLRVLFSPAACYNFQFLSWFRPSLLLLLFFGIISARWTFRSLERLLSRCFPHIFLSRSSVYLYNCLLLRSRVQFQDWNSQTKRKCASPTFIPKLSLISIATNKNVYFSVTNSRHQLFSAFSSKLRFSVE